MQASELRQEALRIKQTIDAALRACRSDDRVPQSLYARVVELERQANDILQLVEATPDEVQLREYIDDLEELADLAKQALEQASGVSAQTRNAILQAHNQISHLKHHSAH